MPVQAMRQELSSKPPRIENDRELEDEVEDFVFTAVLSRDEKIPDLAVWPGCTRFFAAVEHSKIPEPVRVVVELFRPSNANLLCAGEPSWHRTDVYRYASVS